MRLICLCIGLVLAAHASVSSAEEPTRKAVMPSTHLAVFKQCCFDCDDAATKEGNVDLENLPFTISQDIATAEVWAKVLNAINSGENAAPGQLSSGS